MYRFAYWWSRVLCRVLGKRSALYKKADAIARKQLIEEIRKDTPGTNPLHPVWRRR